jgi:hypothetical protein
LYPWQATPPLTQKVVVDAVKLVLKTTRPVSPVKVELVITSPSSSQSDQIKL